MMTKQSPPMPVWCGSTTARTAAAATAASMALPPRRRMSRAAALASGLGVATMASGASAGERPGSWRSRIGLPGLERGNEACYIARSARGRSKEGAMQVTAWHHTSLAVADLDRAIAFYAAAFGYRIAFLERGMAGQIREMTGAPGLTCDIAQLQAPSSSHVLELIAFHGQGSGPE